jgi:acetylornithine/succinyldiaminopimelate/putrescine aminotransferase
MFDLPDSEILSTAMAHNFWTWSAQGRVAPIPVTRAKGVYFWDADDKRYLDFNSMTMCVNIGHGDERVINAIIEQAKTLLPLQGWRPNLGQYWVSYYLKSHRVIWIYSCSPLVVQMRTKMQ